MVTVLVAGIHGFNAEGRPYVMHKDLHADRNVCCRVTLRPHTPGGRYLVRDLTQKSWPTRQFGGLKAVHAYEEEIIDAYKRAQGVEVPEPEYQEIHTVSGGLPTLGKR